VLELEVLLLERDGVVEEELRCIFENRWDSVLGEIQREAARAIREQEGNVVGQAFGEESGQSGECVVRAGGDTLRGAIGEDEDGTDGIDVLLNLSCDALLVVLVLLNTASIRESGRV